MTNANVIGKVKDPIRTLRTIQTVAPNSIIAGGYYRDVYNDVPYSDVDIYVEFKYDEFKSTNTSAWRDLLKLKVDDFRSADEIHVLGDEDETYDVGNDSRIIEVFGLVKSEVRYNIIVVEGEPVDYVQNAFDFNICKNWCDGKRIRFPKEFMADVENKTITFCDRNMSLTEFSHSMNVHLPKLKQKYPNHKLIVPEKHRDVHNKYKKNC